MEKSQLLIKITVRGFDGILTPTLKYLINKQDGIDESGGKNFFYYMKKGNYHINKAGGKNSKKLYK